ncbi:hypothetical protein MZM54_00430 [[Brevibacterium] frigoritolerans]|nr:hypothetical protein [Peribacillus frigoritolerans]
MNLLEMIVSCMILFLSFWLGIILHEIGHLLGALLFKVDVYKMSIGSGENLFSYKIGTFTLEVKKMGQKVEAAVYIKEEIVTEQLRKPIIGMTLSGPIMTFIAITCSVFLILNAPDSFRIYAISFAVGQFLLLFGLKGDFEQIKILSKDKDWIQKTRYEAN